MKEFIINENLVQSLSRCIAGSMHPKFTFEDVAGLIQALNQLKENMINVTEEQA